MGEFITERNIGQEKNVADRYKSTMKFEVEHFFPKKTSMSYLPQQIVSGLLIVHMTIVLCR